MAQSKAKKVGVIILKIFTYMVVAVTIFMMVFTIISVTTFDKNDRSLLGMRMYIVKTDSMSLSENNKDLKVHFDAGDLIIVTEVEKKSTLVAGDIITFISTNPDSYSQTITHMIREVKTTEDGRIIGFVTYGTNTGKNDEALVAPEYVIGKYATQIPKAGLFFAFLKTTPGYVACILVPFLILIGYNGANFAMLFKRYKKEQAEELEAERAKAEAEREHAMEMMKELQALKAQLANGNVNSNVNVAPPAEEAIPDNASEVAVETVAAEETVDAELNRNAAADETTTETPAAEEAAEEVAEETTEVVAEETVETAVEEATEEAKEISAEQKALEEERQKNLEMAMELEKLKAQMALEEERKKNEQMMKELEALKAQLAQKNDENN